MTERWNAREVVTVIEMTLAGASSLDIAAVLPGRSDGAVRGKVSLLRQQGRIPPVSDDAPDDDDDTADVWKDYLRRRDLNERDIDDIVSIAGRIQNYQNQIDPTQLRIDLTFDTDKPVALLFMSCSHLGGRWTAHDAWRRYIDDVLKIPNLYMVSLGDDIEGFLPVGYMSADALLEQSIPVKLQRKMLQFFIRKWSQAGRLVAGCAGQHPSKWEQKLIGTDFIKEMYLDEDVPYFDGKGVIGVHVGSESYLVMVGHQLPGHSYFNSLHAQGRAQREDLPDADVVVQGDKHKYAAAEVQANNFAYSVGERLSPTVWLLQAGTAKTGPEPYTVRWFSPGSFIWPIAVFFPDRHEVQCTRHLTTACHWLQQTCPQPEQQTE